MKHMQKLHAYQFVSITLNIIQRICAIRRRLPDRCEVVGDVSKYVISKPVGTEIPKLNLCPNKKHLKSQINQKKKSRLAEQ